jgi:uncharacterized OB-fold protein
VKAAAAPATQDPSEVFFAGCARGELLLLRCADCATWSFPGVLLAPALRPRCPECLSADLAWKQSSGLGALYTFTTVHRRPDVQRSAPRDVCLVELDEGPRIFTSVVERDDANLVIGMRLRVAFEPTGTGVLRPVFKLDDRSI